MLPKPNVGYTGHTCILAQCVPMCVSGKMGQAKPRQQSRRYLATYLPRCGYLRRWCAGQRRRISVARRLCRFVSLLRPSALSVWVLPVETA